jgi:hypothetical protein
MRPNDRAADRKPYPHPLRFRADEWLEELRYDLFGKAGTRVRDAYFDERFRDERRPDRLSPAYFWTFPESHLGILFWIVKPFKCKRDFKI